MSQSATVEYKTYRKDRSDYRNVSSPYGEEWTPRQMSLGKALRTLIEFELGYGGRVTSVEADRLVIQTPVLSKTDTIIVIGQADELTPIFEYVYLFLQLESPDDAKTVFDRYEGTAMETMMRRPLYLTTLGVMELGTFRAHRALVAFLSESEEDARYFMPLPRETLLEMIEMKVDLGMDAAAIRKYAG